MYRLSALLIALMMVISFTGISAAAGGWNKCAMCHKPGKKMMGKPVPSKEELLKRYKTGDELIKAAKASKSPIMKAFKKDSLLNAAVKDLYK
jgi:hypothetical protein